MRIPLGTAAALTLATSLVGVPAHAQSVGAQPHSVHAHSAKPAEQGPTGKLSPSDEAFLRNEVRTANAELAYGRLARQNGASPEVRQLGRQMENNAQNDLKHLGSVAGAEGRTDSKEINPEDRQAIDTLSQLHGRAFDQQFVNRVQSLESTELGMLEEEAYTASNAELQSYANDAKLETRQLVNESASIGVAEKQAPNP